MNLRGKEKNMVGFSNDLIQAAANEQGMYANVFEVGRNALLDGLHTGDYDAILSSIPPNAINLKKYGFSDSFYLLGPVLIVRENSNAKSLKDMKGQIMGVERGALQVLAIPEPPGVILIPYITANAALEHLDDNAIDGVMLDALRAYVFTKGFYSGRLKVVTSPLTDLGLRVITRNEPESLLFLSRFDEGLKAVKKSGLYDKLIEKWDLIDTEI